MLTLAAAMAEMELAHAIGFSGTADRPMHVEADGDGVVLASGGTIILGSLSDPHRQRFLRGHNGAVSCLASSPSFVVSGQSGGDPDVVVWDRRAGGAERYRFQEHDVGIASVAVTDCERFLATVGAVGDNKMVVWDLMTGMLVAHTEKLRPTVQVAWGGRKKNVKGRDTTQFQLATCGDGHLAYWVLDPESGALRQDADGSGRGHLEMGSQKRDYACVEFSADRELLFAGSTSGDFSGVHVKERTLHSVTAACHCGVTSLLAVAGASVGENMREILVGGGDGTVASFVGNNRAYRPHDRIKVDGGVTRLQGPLPGPLGDPPQYAAATDKGLVFVVALYGGSGASKLVLESHFSPVLAVAYPPDASDLFATAAADGTIRVWDASDYTARVVGQTAIAHSGPPSCLSFTGEVVYTGWKDGKRRRAAAAPLSPAAARAAAPLRRLCPRLRLTPVAPVNVSQARSALTRRGRRRGSPSAAAGRTPACCGRSTSATAAASPRSRARRTRSSS